MAGRRRRDGVPADAERCAAGSGDGVNADEPPARAARSPAGVHADEPPAEAARPSAGVHADDPRSGAAPARRVVRGRDAERAAEAYLVARGFRILGRNVRYRDGELDLVALDGAEVVFVEVRARRSGSRFDPASLGAAKRAALVRAATRWVGENGAGDRPCRFDLVALRLREGGWAVEHIRGAFVDEG